MMTVITYVTLRQGAEPEWDAVMRERLANATARAGFMRGQFLIPAEGLNRRVIIGSWRSRADWEAWHLNDAFVDSRDRLEGLQEGPSEMAWHEVVMDQPARRWRNALQGAVATGKRKAKLVTARLRTEQRQNPDDAEDRRGASR